MTAIKRPSTALRRGRDIIARAWCKNNFGICSIRHETNATPDKFCALGALFDALGAKWENFGRVTFQGRKYMTLDPTGVDVVLYDKCQGYLRDALSSITGINREHANVAAYNDVKGRKRKDVLAVYDLAIKLAERDEWAARQRASRQRRATVDA